MAPAPPTPSTPPLSSSSSLPSSLPWSDTHFTPDSLLRHTDRITASAPCRLRTFAGRITARIVVVFHSTADPTPPALTRKASVGPGSAGTGGWQFASATAPVGDVEYAVLIISAPSSSAPPTVLRALPISRGFKHALTQVPPSPSTSFFAQSSKPHMELSLIAEGQRSIDLQIPSTETARVQLLTRELRKAVDASKDRSMWSHAWLSFYSIEEEDPNTPMTVINLTPSASNSSLERAFADVTSPDLADRTTDDGVPNPFAPGFSRTAFLRSRLAARENKWASSKPVTIRVATYNVNDRVPPPGTKELAPLVGDDDVLVLGLQEADLRSQALLVSQGSVRAEAWEKALVAALGERSEEYEKIAAVQYVGVLMIVLVRKSLKEVIGKVETAARGIGLLGFGGNKAGVAVRFKIYDTTLCFVNSHLAAFANQLERRRLDFAALKTGLVFPVPTDVNPALDEWIPEGNRLIGLDDCDVLFWLGDLNYRIDLEDSDLRSLVANKEWDKVVAADQLLADIAAAKSFTGFTEPDINFPPSFKYVHGSTTLDPKRAPAYTDRVLHLSRGPAVLPTSYTSHEILWSDHLPVSAGFEVTARVADVSAKLAELAGANSELDRLEEVYRPSLKVSEDLVEFGQVKFRQIVTRGVELRNDGRVPATYTFRAPAPGKPICKQWFFPFPPTGVVQSGSSQTVRVTAFVDEAHAAGLTAGDEMNDVLVLQVLEGKDSFISLRASFAPSIVGLELGTLPSLPSPIRDVPLAERKELLVAQRAAYLSTASPTPVVTPAVESPPVVFTAKAEDANVASAEAAPDLTVSNTPAEEVKKEEAKQEAKEKEEKEVEKKEAETKGEEKKDADAKTLAESMDSVNLDDEPNPSPVPAAEAPTPSPAPTTTTAPNATKSPTPATTASPTTLTAPIAPTLTRTASSASASAKPPREMWRLLERLMEMGVGVEGLWTTAMNRVERDDVVMAIEALDTGAPLVADPPTTAATLLVLLQCLPVPLVPPTHAAFCLKTQGDRDEAYAVLEGVPGSYTNVLIGLTSVVRLCLGPAELDDETADVLASAVFGTSATGSVGAGSAMALGLGMAMGLGMGNGTAGASTADKAARAQFIRALMEG